MERLLALRDLLHAEPRTFEQICACLPDEYSEDENGKRKLRRDLQHLERWGYQKDYSRLAKTYALVHPRIEGDWSEQELGALAALRESFTPSAPCAENIQPILQRIERGLGEPQRKLYLRKPALRIQFAVAEEKSPPANVQCKLEEALREHRRIRFEYRPLDRAKVIEHADDEPLALEFRDGHYYLSAYCYKMSRVYDFRVDMIVPHSVQVLPKRAERGWRRKMVDFQYRVSPKIAARGISLRFPEIVSIEPQKDGGVIVTARAYDEFWIIRELLRYGEQAQLVAPKSLWAKMRAVVQKMAGLYGLAVG